MGNSAALTDQTLSEQSKRVSLDKVIREQVRLPSPPSIAVKILNAVQSEDSSLQQLAEIIAADPALSVKLLRVANSGFYALKHQVKSIDRALSVLGTNLIKNIALSFVIAGDLKGQETAHFDVDYFWRRAVTAAVAAELLTQALRQKNEDIFVTALLQDIGILILALNKGGVYDHLLEERLVSDLSLCALEQEAFGFDHQDLGATLLKSWNLPDAIFEPIQYHHSEAHAPDSCVDTARILSASTKISAIYMDANSAEKVRTLQRLLPAQFSLSEDQVRTLVDDVATRSIDILQIFDIDPGDLKPYSQMLQEANEQLGELNLSYEQLVMEFKEAKESAEELAMQLRDANTRLKELVFRDGLTGLFNHRYFQENLEKELMRALRQQASVSLLMVDIDYFKTVNDTHGHPVGDLVLKSVAQLLEQSIRTTDIIARYGGEEFAIILPMTNEVGMRVFAERLRRRVAATATDIGNDLHITVTISIGGACRSGERSDITREQLIEIADKALYLSKQHGRNRTTILSP